ncbi:serine/threonine-protein kinase [Aliikangiella sp. G2MR2-5]|uniref:serine/threonine-protein kinase n=1 Tax=Aliikangiella sp. G2MR2-5 TaxID=2788943 RepID=UPI0018AA74C8|nr:serine/threonine-protein kinase [Aliikangiella sp. G2MR2-5]
MAGNNENTNGQITDSVTSDTDSAEALVELTRIGQSLYAKENRQGFIKAKADVDKALAENKIVLKNRFVLQSALGAGGMGTVYKAQDLRKVEARDTNPFVAAKVLNADFKEHPDAFIALQREASRSSRLSHPNIVTVHDFDRDGDTIYMTMELLEGEDLDQILKRHAKKGLGKEKAFKILQDIFSALSFAHQKGIIHCDLKPANIFVTKEGAKILDFGIARLALKNQDHFDAGTIGALTPSYASLEMFSNEDPSPSDDVYAAAIIAYQLLSGKHPYQQKSAPAALSMELEPPMIEGLSKRQWRALSNALKLKKTERTQTIEEFSEALLGKRQLSQAILLSSLIAVSVGAIAYTQFFNHDQIDSVIQKTLATAEECHLQKDYECVQSSVNAILKIKPEHQLANELLSRVQVEQESQRVLLLLQEGQKCLAAKSYQCAVEKSDEILAVSADNIEATKLKAVALEAMQLISTQLKQALTEAETCLQKKNYQCTIDNSTLAIKIDPTNAQAVSLRQSAIIAGDQQKEALLKAKDILNDGKKCFAKYDYSCAIAKSESALAFVPDYQPALELKKSAEKAIADAKKAIRIE